MNGRRLANTAFNGGMVDINAIPLSAIERIEVLTDGASAIYGTDAIAGVINFILRKDFTGVEAYAYYGDSEQGGGKIAALQRHARLGRPREGQVQRLRHARLQQDRGDRAPRSARSRAPRTCPNAPGGVYDRTSGNSIPGQRVPAGRARACRHDAQSRAIRTACRRTRSRRATPPPRGNAASTSRA